MNNLVGKNIKEPVIRLIKTIEMAILKRMLDSIYPIVYLDAVHFKVRDEHRIVTKAAYICLEIDMEGDKDILGIWIGEAEGVKFWLGVCNNLKNRGVKDILIACMDGLKGLPYAIKEVFPEVNIQSCIIHQIRNSIKYVSYKNKKEVVRDLKLIYKAPTEEIALTQLDSLKEKWNSQYPMIIDSWYNNWNKLSAFFAYTEEIRKIIYTTNALEGFNRQLRKFTKTKTVFPTNDLLGECLCIATDCVMKKWTTPIIKFKERIENI